MKEIIGNLIGPSFTSGPKSRVTITGFTATAMLAAGIGTAVFMLSGDGFTNRLITGTWMGLGTFVAGGVTTIGIASNASQLLRDNPSLTVLPVAIGAIAGSWVGAILLPVALAFVALAIPSTSVAKTVYPPAHDGPELVDNVDKKRQKDAKEEVDRLLEDDTEPRHQSGRPPIEIQEMH